MENAQAFTVRLQELLRRERSALAEFIVALAEFDRRRLWVDVGHASLFSFLHRELGLSKGAAFYRKTAAELVQKFPEIVEPLRDGRLCFTSVVELARVLTPENRHEVLPRFFLLSKREAKEVSAEIRPVEAPPRRDVVTVARTPAVVPALLLVTQPDLRQVRVHPDEPVRANSNGGAPSPAASAGGAAAPNGELPMEAAKVSAPVIGVSPASAARAEQVEPITADASRLHVTVSRRFLKKLEAARDALSHSHPGAGMEEILEAGLDLLLERHARRKGVVKKPLREPRPSKPEHVPAHVVRAVWTRDDGRCQWKLASGGICGSTVRVEIDHRLAKALGGPATIENLRCLCRPHNDLAAVQAGTWVTFWTGGLFCYPCARSGPAREVFGDGWMDRYTRGNGCGGRRRSNRSRGGDRGEAAGQLANGAAGSSEATSPPCPRPAP